jgi:ABC-type branched-subunit amino acid transport system ATPase component
VKHNETVGVCYGINITIVKVIAFGSSAMLLSTGGFFWAAYQRSIVWTEFGVLLSCLLLSLVVVGGQGNPIGVVLGATVIGTSQELLRRILTSCGLPQNIRYLVFAIALVLFVHLRHRGILPDRPKWRLHGMRKPLRQEGRTPSPNAAPSSRRSLLKVEEVHKAFGGLHALKGVSLDIAVRECIALIGPNGSGKSTLLNLICGLIKPDKGTIHFDAVRIDRMATHKIARLGVRRSFQDLSVFDDLDVQDNICTTASGASLSDVDAVVGRFRLPAKTERCESLSYGAKKSLDLARMFVQTEGLRLVMLDEPTAGLTQTEASDIVRSLSDIRAEGEMAMVIVSHDLMFLEALNVDRVVVMDAGSVFRVGDFHSIRADSEVVRLFWVFNYLTK